MKSFLDKLKKYFESLLDRKILTTDQLASSFLEISPEELNFKDKENGELQNALIGIIKEAYPTNKSEHKKDSSNLKLSSITFRKFGEKVDMIINSNIPGRNIIVTNKKKNREASTQYSPEEFTKKLLEQFNNISLKDYDNDQRKVVELYLAEMEGLLLSGVSNNLIYMVRCIIKSFEKDYENGRASETNDETNGPTVTHVNAGNVDGQSRHIDRAAGIGGDSNNPLRRKNNVVPQDTRYKCLFDMLDAKNDDLFVTCEVKYKYGKSENYNAYVYHRNDSKKGVCIIFEPFSGESCTRIKCLTEEELDGLLDTMDEQEKDDTFWGHLVKYYMEMDGKTFNSQGTCATLHHAIENTYLETLKIIVEYFKEGEGILSSVKSVSARNRANAAIKKLTTEKIPDILSAVNGVTPKAVQEAARILEEGRREPNTREVGGSKNDGYGSI